MRFGNLFLSDNHGGGGDGFGGGGNWLAPFPSFGFTTCCSVPPVCCSPPPPEVDLELLPHPRLATRQAVSNAAETERIMRSFLQLK